MKNKETLEEVKPKDIQRIISSTDAQTASIEIVGLFNKWQKEQDKNKYSEEEVLKLVDNLFHKYSSDFRVSAKIDAKEWLEQFKKK